MKPVGQFSRPVISIPKGAGTSKDKRKEINVLSNLHLSPFTVQYDANMAMLHVPALPDVVYDHTDCSHQKLDSNIYLYKRKSKQNEDAYFFFFPVLVLCNDSTVVYLEFYIIIINRRINRGTKDLYVCHTGESCHYMLIITNQHE